jgi:hypothetical protein
MVEYIYVKQVVMSIMSLLVPYSILVFYIRSIEKSITIYLTIFLVSFIVYSLLQYDRLNIVIYLTLYLLAMIIYKLKRRQCEIKKYRIEYKDIIYIILIVALSILSYFIPINQNWDFYTFYAQIIYSSIGHTLAPLFNNIQIMMLVTLKEFGILPRFVATFFLINLLLLLYKFFEKNMIFTLLLITNIPIYVSLVNENNYLELSSLTLLMLFLVNYYRYGSNNIYTKLSGLLLFFTKGNLSFVIGSYVNLILTIQTIINIFKKNKKNVIYDLIYLILLGATITYFINNYIKYFAINFEVFFMFQFLTLNILQSEEWFSIVSGFIQLPTYQSILMKLSNILNPIYNLFIPFLMFIISKKYKALISINLSRFEVGLLSIYILYIFSPFFPTTDTFSNIFTIRYYIFFTFLIFLIFLKKIELKNNLFYYMVAFVSLFFYCINILESGPFMKEKLILNYLNSLHIYHMLSIGFLFLLFYYLPPSINKYKINFIVQLILYLFILGISVIIILIFVYPLIVTSYSLRFFTDSTEYNCLVHALFPKLYNEYFKSYCENDAILIDISHKCRYVYSIGGIYSPSVLYISNITVFIRGGHISLLPFILYDLKLHNLTSYHYIVNKYSYLKSFQFPSNLCFQIPSPNHKEFAFIKSIKMLNQTSISFSIIYSTIIINPKPIGVYNYYIIYNVTNPLSNS